MRKIKITIEYELDDDDATLETERKDWLDGAVDMNDIIATDGLVTFEIIQA